MDATSYLAVGPSLGTLTVDRLPSCACERYAAVQLDPHRPQVSRPEDAAELLAPELVGHPSERFGALLLDTKHRTIDGPVVVSIGTLDHTFMSPRDLLRIALLANAAAVVVAHNHPSGDPEPSRDDEAVTRRLVQAGEVVGVEVLDHLVIGGDRWVSLARQGKL